jgi:DNA-binding Xre family transcriptional regulator
LNQTSNSNYLVNCTSKPTHTNMLKYNSNKIFIAKGIDRPFTFLKQAGFSDTFASKVKNGQVNRLTLDLLERLCLSIGCTPNDFMEWEPSKGQNLDGKHPLYELRKADKILELSRSLNLLSLSKLEEIERLINENK